MEKETFLSLGVELEAYDGPPLVGFGDHRLKPLGTCRVDCRVFGGFGTHTLKFLVTEAQYMEFDVILGGGIFEKLDFYRRNKIIWV